MLTDYQKLFVLFTKGYFRSYENPEKNIVGKALVLYPKDVSHQNLENYAIRLFDKLMMLGMIEGAEEDKYKWMIQEMLNSVNLLKKPTLYEWLLQKIEWCNCEDLSENEIKRLTKLLEGSFEQ